MADVDKTTTLIKQQKGVRRLVIISIVDRQRKKLYRSKMRQFKRRAQCCVCCKREYYHREPINPGFVPDQTAAVDYDSLQAISDALALGFNIPKEQLYVPTTPRKLDPSTAKKVAKRSTQQARKVAVSAWGGNIEDRDSKKALMAPFHRNEINLGKLLGVGGFAHVFELKSFNTERNTATNDSKATTTASQSSNNSLPISLSRTTTTMNQCYLCDQQHKTRESLLRRIETCHEDMKQSNPAANQEPFTTPYAIKHIRPSLLDAPEKFAEAAMDLAREAEFLLYLSHPNIIQLHGCSTGGPNAYKDGRNDSYFLITDRLQETLKDRIGKWREQWKKEHSLYALARKRIQRCIPRRRTNQASKDSSSKLVVPVHDSIFSQRVKVAHTMSCALEYMHEKRVIHRDFKSVNVGFDLRGDVRVFDFGVARILPSSAKGDEGGESFKMTCIGTKLYMAPEVWTKSYNLKADVYSFGVTLWELLSMSRPTKVKKPKDKGTLPEKRKQMDVCSCWPLPLQDLVTSMLADEAADRPTMAEVRKVLEQTRSTILT